MLQPLLFQGDEDTRRAMMKSFVESNGTVLSTNWQEVGAKPVEFKTPEVRQAGRQEVGCRGRDDEARGCCVEATMHSPLHMFWCIAQGADVKKWDI